MRLDVNEEARSKKEMRSLNVGIFVWLLLVLKDDGKMITTSRVATMKKT
jgi:hypothetical protein